MDKRAIGVFDSGLGGLTVLKEIKKILPNENIIYFGDTARVPYGSKSKQQVLEYTIEAIDFFVLKNVKAVVIACNTATASALNEVKSLYDVPIIGVVGPGARAVSKVSKSKEVLVLGTEGTVRLKAYEDEISKYDEHISVVSKACPLFVSLVEGGMVDTSVSYCVVRDSVKEFKNTRIDSVVLGCTHYPYLKKEIREVLGSGIKIVDPAIETVVDLNNILYNKNLLKLDDSGSVCEFYVSKDPQKFKDIAQEFMKIEIDEVKQV